MKLPIQIFPVDSIAAIVSPVNDIAKSYHASDVSGISVQFIPLLSVKIRSPPEPGKFEPII